MTKKKPTIKKVAHAEAEPIEPEPAEELPVRQIEESPIEPAPGPVEQSAEPEPVAETAPIVEVVAEPEKSAEVVSPPVECLNLHPWLIKTKLNRCPLYH